MAKWGAPPPAYPQPEALPRAEGGSGRPRHSGATCRDFEMDMDQVLIRISTVSGRTLISAHGRCDAQSAQQMKTIKPESAAERRNYRQLRKLKDLAQNFAFNFNPGARSCCPVRRGFAARRGFRRLSERHARHRSARLRKGDQGQDVSSPRRARASMAPIYWKALLKSKLARS